MAKRAIRAALISAGVFAKIAVSLGQTLPEMEAVYGSPARIDVFNGRRFAGFERPGMTVIAALDGDKSAALLFRRGAGEFSSREVRRLLARNAAGFEWLQVSEQPKKWTRSDCLAFAFFAEAGDAIGIYGAGPGEKFIEDVLQSP